MSSTKNNQDEQKPLDTNSTKAIRSKKATGVAIIALSILVPALLLFSAFQNPAWVKTAPVKRIESFIAGALMANVNMVTIPTKQVLHPITRLDDADLEQIESGRYTIVPASDIASLRSSNPGKTSSSFTIATIGPVDLNGKIAEEKRRIVEDVYDAAFDGKIDAVVESTESDRLLAASGWGRREVARLYETGVIRCVIFDGAHHVGSLGLKPDILLVPAMFHKGDLYATHAFTRDSVSIDKLRQTIEREYVGSTIAQFPRIGIPVKNSSAMGKIAFHAIANITSLTNSKLKGDKSEPKSIKKNENIADANNITKITKNGAETGEATSTPENKNVSKSKKADESKYEYIPMRKGIVFVSCDVGESPTKDEILTSIRTEVNKQVVPGQHIRRVYAGLTFGVNQFPQRKPVISIDNKELQKYLFDNLPYATEIISEPVSAWDIVRARLNL